jgi:hypothetical protein
MKLNEVEIRMQGIFLRDGREKDMFVWENVSKEVVGRRREEGLSWGLGKF